MLFAIGILCSSVHWICQLTCFASISCHLSHRNSFVLHMLRILFLNKFAHGQIWGKIGQNACFFRTQLLIGPSPSPSPTHSSIILVILADNSTGYQLNRRTSTHAHTHTHCRSILILAVCSTKLVVIDLGGVFGEVSSVCHSRRPPFFPLICRARFCAPFQLAFYAFESIQRGQSLLERMINVVQEGCCTIWGIFVIIDHLCGACLRAITTVMVESLLRAFQISSHPAQGVLCKFAIFVFVRRYFLLNFVCVNAATLLLNKRLQLIRNDCTHHVLLAQIFIIWHVKSSVAPKFEVGICACHHTLHFGAQRVCLRIN